VMFELLDHIAGQFGLEDEVDRLLDRFASLDAAILNALGADKLRRPPLRLVEGYTDWSGAP
jgi:hypothetical protein